MTYSSSAFQSRQVRIHVVGLGLARSSDDELLTVARREERVIITADLDYPRLIDFPSSKRFIDEIGLAELPARTVRRCGTEWTLARIGEVTSGADHIFLSVDIDVLDPAHAPGVGWHEPGGLTSGELLDLLVALAPCVDGFALNEVNPLTDAGPKTTILAANLVSKFVVAAGRNEG